MVLARVEHKPWKRRGRLDVIACILREALEWATKTRLVYRANLNFRLLGKYLDFLISRGLLEKANVHSLTLYRTTKKGRVWLSLYAKLVELLGESLAWC
ncbi:MAG TPA: hypothetical protein ENG43_01280 [Candidatus Bathyarchaeota archaeon]|nr:hypothetical protein [Candidatus Bathyarchaeota archaeon]HEW89961.1 hypothetical protein [Candidatus Bathyarchaeota archaeon]